MKSEELHTACRHAEGVFQLLGRVHEARVDQDGVDGPVSRLVYNGSRQACLTDDSLLFVR